MVEKVEKKNTDEKLSDMIMKHLKAVQDTEENNLIEIQRNIFLNWKQNRTDLIKAQVISGKILKLISNFIVNSVLWIMN